MQEALVSPANADRLRSVLELKPFAFGDQRLSSPRYLAGGGGCGNDALFRCSSPFSPSFGFSSPSPHATSVSLSPSSSGSVVDDGDDAAAAAAAADATGQRLQLARLALQYQEVADRYELCLAHLAEAVDEAAALRRENAELRVTNSDLTRRLALLIGKQTAAAAVADEIRRLCLGQHKAPAIAKERAPEKLPVLPKSISVRSNGYLKMNQPAQAPASPAANNRKPRPSNTNSQRVYVSADGGKKGDEPKEQGGGGGGGVELEVYNQGMFKTELCNKWEETGACPYGDQCQFAHGVAELRPVIRHPRYKTQVCRMVLAGERCPYGHRCHFRHTLTPADRLL
ncbi:hypothetical protein ACP4OV_027559 [Aristida adscensionis]